MPSLLFSYITYMDDAARNSWKFTATDQEILDLYHGAY